MSFIFEDKKLMQELLKYGQEFQNKFYKGAQAVPDMKNYLMLSRKLIDQLEQSEAPKEKDPNAPTVISTLSDKGATLDVTQLNSWGNFLSFIASNQIMADGQRIVYAANEPPQDDKYLPVDGERFNYMEGPNREAPKNKFFVNQQLLEKYLVSLQATAKKTNNKVMEVMVGKRVEDLNNKLGSKLDNKYKEPEFILKDTTELTSFPQIIDYDKYEPDGPKKLLYKDILSANTLSAWAMSNGIQLKFTGKEREFVKVTDRDFDFCSLIRVIYAKANYLLTRASPEQVRDRTIFINKLREIGPTIKNNNGGPCSLDGSTVNQKGTEKDRGGKSDQDMERLVNGLLTKLPYKQDIIDFNRIKIFLEAYQQIDSASAPYASDIIGVISEMASIYGVPSGQMLNVGADRVQRSLKSPDLILPYLKDLQFIVDNTVKVLAMLKSSQGDHFNPAMNNAFNEQMGSGIDDAFSLGGKNASVIDRWLSDAQRNLVRRVP